MSVWARIEDFLHSWYGQSVAIVGFILAIYYGPRKMFETWDWYIARFIDEPVLDILREHDFLAEELRPPRYKERTALTVGDLAQKLKRNHRSVGRSIKRLKRRGLIELYGGGFRLKS